MSGVIVLSEINYIRSVAVVTCLSGFIAVGLLRVILGAIRKWRPLRGGGRSGKSVRKGKECL